MSLWVRFGPHLICMDAAERSVLSVLAQAWRPGVVSGPSSETVQPRLHYEFDERGSLLCNGQLLWREVPQELQAVRLSGHLIENTPALSSTCWSLHAGGVVFRQSLPETARPHLIVFVGVSDAGKSSMTRAALRAGAQYLSDDMLVVEEDSLYGLPRNIQFNAVERGAPIPTHVEDCDCSTYSYTFEGKSLAIPLWRPEHPALGAVAWSKYQVSVLQVQRGSEDRVERASELERLQILFNATLKPTSPGVLAQRLGALRCYHVTWCSPDRAWELVQRTLSV